MKNPNEMSTVVCLCPFCSKLHAVDVNESDFQSWINGTLAQEAFPYLTPTEREQLISGICPECQNDIFGEDDDLIENDDGRFHLIYEDDDGFLAEIETDFDDGDFSDIMSAL